jgi:catechol 2,3-dioxygenase-like lactoylglutathione lyase family enzyme
VLDTVIRLLDGDKDADHGGLTQAREIRAYVRDPDGHLIEVGQTTGLLD